MKKVASVQSLHVKYEGGKAVPKTNTQYLDILKTVYKMMFNELLMKVLQPNWNINGW